ncbi:hypothetical protein G5C60_39355 [Streptomyces sp. HC44]|uniref:Uncharacterized protein n=1 Tax=Streptomyces scabichelini TaxID=2711217 RepID=A0A6G4VHC1_9ACTN|nr:DUF6069 family protein [Streptomyces scabichelini]NGO13499.1 hypothetical protein [Streptomyces scabichelini]
MSVTAPQTQTTVQSPSLASSPSSTRFTRSLATRAVWQVGVLATLAGAIVTEVFGLIARGVGVPMAAASPGAKEAAEITAGAFVGGVLFWSIPGIVLAVVLARWAKRPARTFVVITVALTALSLAGPAVAPHTATSTQVVLALSHVVAAAVIIPALARRLAQHRR